MPSSVRRTERRDVPARDALLRRVWMEFVEMPCLSLTGPQAQRLFALRADVAQRVLRGLVEAEALTLGYDRRYRLRERVRHALAHRPAPDLNLVGRRECETCPVWTPAARLVKEVST
jgi:hypothetical protein